MKDGIIPPIINEIMEFIASKGVLTEGIFRKSASISELQDMKNRINHGKKVIVAEHDPIAIAALLKLFFRELETPVFGNDVAAMMDVHIIGKDLNQSELALMVKNYIIPLLPLENRIILKALCHLLWKVAENSAQNLMSTSNLAVVMTPNLFRSTNMADEFRIFGSSQMILCCIIDTFPQVFE